MRRFGRGDNPARASERGETLVELLFAMSILAFAVVTIVGTMAVAITLSTKHRQQADANTYLVNAAENVKAAPYVECQNNPSYSHGLGQPPSGWTFTVSGASAVTQDPDTGTVTVAACPGAGDTKVEQVNVRIDSPSGYHVSTDVLKRCKTYTVSGNVATCGDA
jgi:hypothetical protein